MEIDDLILYLTPTHIIQLDIFQLDLFLRLLDEKGFLKPMRLLIDHLMNAGTF